MSRRDSVIWAAGFLDGEGCISIIRRNKHKDKIVEHYSLQITVFQNIKDPLDVLAALFEGSVRRRDSGWIWLLTGRATISALEELIPFLLVKRTQAEAAILFQSRKVDRGGKYDDPVAARELDRIDHAKIRDLKIVSLKEVLS